MSVLAPPPSNIAAELGPSQFDWWFDWRGECVAIVASGPSVKNANVGRLRGRIHVAAVNNSVELCPWADLLYSCDANWWTRHNGAPEFRGLKITQDAAACGKYPSLRKVHVEAKADELTVDRPGYLAAGGNSGFQAANLVTQFGVAAIALVGFDMQGAHWHGRHPPPLSNPDESSFPRWRRALDGAAGKFCSLGIDVVNCSFESSLKAYPKMSIEAALARWGL